MKIKNLIKELLQAQEEYLELKTLAESKGGKILLRAAQDDLMTSIDKLCADYTRLSHTEMIAECANIKTKLDIIRTISKAATNYEAVTLALEAENDKYKQETEEYTA